MDQLPRMLKTKWLASITLSQLSQKGAMTVGVLNRGFCDRKHGQYNMICETNKIDPQSRFGSQTQFRSGSQHWSEVHGRLKAEDEFCDGCRRTRTEGWKKRFGPKTSKTLIPAQVYRYYGSERRQSCRKQSGLYPPVLLKLSSSSDKNEHYIPNASFHTTTHAMNDNNDGGNSYSGDDTVKDGNEHSGDIKLKSDREEQYGENVQAVNMQSQKTTMGNTPIINSTGDTSVADVMDKHEGSNGNGVLNCLKPSDFLLEPDIEKFLDEMGIEYEKGYTCHCIVCPKFGKLAMRMKKEGDKLFINSLSGYFQCNHCGTSGNWVHLRDNILFLRSKRANRTRECFKDVDDVERIAVESPAEVVRQMEGSIEFSALTDEQFDTILSIFDWHGLHHKTFTQYGVRCKVRDNRYTVLFPIQCTTGVVTAVRVYSALVTDDGDIKLFPVLTYPRMKEVTDLFGWQKAPVGGKLVVTVGDVNAMAVTQETGTTALALRNITHLPQELLPSLESINKIILWLGTDIKAWENTKTFAKKINDRRCYIFRPNMLKRMPTEVAQMRESVSKILGEARLISHKAILTFSNLRQEVYSELAHHGQVAGIQWKRYTKLNDLLKGHRRGELTVLTGPTGSGKTTFMSDYSLDLCMQGVNTLWGSFEISNVRLVKVMLQQYAGKSIVKNLGEFDQIADDFSTLPMYFMTYFGQEQITRVLEAMSHAVYVHDISHVIVDNLQFMIGMDFSEQNRFLRQDAIVAQFRKFATEKNCHVTLIIHPRKVNEGEELYTASIFGSAKVTQEADNILLIQDQRLVKPSGRKYLQITKNRFDGDLGVMVLTFSKDSLSFSLNEKKKNVRKMEDWRDDEHQE